MKARTNQQKMIIVKFENCAKTQEELICHKLPSSLADNTVSALFHSFERVSLCCISWQNIPYYKSVFSKGCAGGEPDSVRSAGRVIEEDRVFV